MLGVFQVSALMVGALSFSQMQGDWTRYTMQSIKDFKSSFADQPSYNEVQKHLSTLDFSGLGLTPQHLLGFERMRKAFSPLIISLADGGLMKNKDDDSKKTLSLLNDWSQKTNNNKNSSAETSALTQLLKKESPTTDQLILSAFIFNYQFPTNKSITDGQLEIAGQYLSGTFDYTDAPKTSDFLKFLSQSIYYNEKIASTDMLKFSVFERADLSPMWAIKDFNTIQTQYSNWGNFSAFQSNKGRELARFYISSPEHAIGRLEEIFRTGLKSQVEGAKLANAKQMTDFTFDDGFLTSGLTIKSDEYYDNIGCLNDVLKNQYYMQDIWNIKDPEDNTQYLYRDIFTDVQSLINDPNSKMPIIRADINIFENKSEIVKYKFAVLHNLLNAKANLELALDKFVYGFLEQVSNGETNNSKSGGKGPIKFKSQKGVDAWKDYLLKIEEIFSKPEALKNLLNNIVEKELIKDQAMLTKLEEYSKQATPALDDESKNAVRAEILKRVLRFRLFFSASQEIPEPPEMKDSRFYEKSKIALWQSARPLLYFYDYQKDISLTPPDKFAHLIDGVHFDLFNLRNATPKEAKNLSFCNNTFAYHLLFGYMERLKKQGIKIALDDAFRMEQNPSNYNLAALKKLLPHLIIGKNGEPTGEWDIADSIFFVVYETPQGGIINASDMSYRDAKMQGYQPFFMLKESEYAKHYDDTGRQDWLGKFQTWQRNRKPRGSTKEYDDYPTFDIYNDKYRMLGLNSEGAQQIAIVLGDPPKKGTYYVDTDPVEIPYDVKKRNSFINLDEGKTYETNWEYLISGIKDENGNTHDANALEGIDSWGAFSVANVFSPAPLLGTITPLGIDRAGIIRFPISENVMPQNLEQFAPRDYKAEVTGKTSSTAYNDAGTPISVDIFNIRLTVSWTDRHAILSNGILYDPFTYLSAGHGSLNWQEYVVNENINPLDKTEFYNAAWKLPIFRKREYNFTVRREARQEVVTKTTQPNFPEPIWLNNEFKVKSIKKLTADGKLIFNQSQGAIIMAVEGGLVPPDLAGQIVQVDKETRDQKVMENAIPAANLPINSVVVRTMKTKGRMSFYLVDKNNDSFELKLRPKSLFDNGKELYYDSAMLKSKQLPSKNYELYDEKTGMVVGEATVLYNKQPGEEVFDFKNIQLDMHTGAMRDTEHYDTFIRHFRTDEHGVPRGESDMAVHEAAKAKKTTEPTEYPLFEMEAKNYVIGGSQPVNIPGEFHFTFDIDKDSPEYKALQKRVVGEDNPDVNNWILENAKTGGNIRLKSRDAGQKGSTEEKNYLLHDDDGNILLEPTFNLETKQWEMQKGPHLEKRLKKEVSKEKAGEPIGALEQFWNAIPTRA